MSGYSSFAAYYDRLTENVDYDGIAAYYDTHIRKNTDIKGILLDLACGTGSLSTRFSALGYDVIGTDGSEEMLSEAMNKPHEGIQLLRQDMTELDMFGTIDVTVCALDSLNHLESAGELQKTFDRVSLFTNSGGLFLFDINTPYKHENVLGDNTFVYDLEGLYCVWQNYNDGSGATSIELDFFEQEGDVYLRSHESFTERAFELDAVSAMLKRAGFKVLECLDYLTEKPLSDDSEKAFFVARKI